MSRTLVINTAFLGDVIFTAPLIDALLAAGHAVSLLTRPRYGALLGRENLDLVEYDKRQSDRGFAATLRLGKALRARRYDLVLGAHPSIRSGILALSTQAPRRLGWGPLGYTARVQRGPLFVDDALALARAAGIDAPLCRPRIATLATRRPRHVALMPGSRWATKRWPARHWAGLAQALTGLGYTLVWVGGPGEDALVEGAGEQHFERSLARAATVLAGCAVAVGGDSGLAHLARAVDTPVVMLFGPTGAGRHPPDAERLDLSVAPLLCRPCSPHGPKSCPLTHHRCMQDLQPGAVLRGIQALIGTGSE
ncbi:MAG: heptosyltransferase-2 [Bradymonadia bacterium]|jgi:heptosyltransferase-2